MKVLITSTPFALSFRRPLELLEAAGLEYQLNPFERRLTEDELITLISDVSILIAGTERISGRAMDAAPKLRLIARIGIGLDSVDLEAARKRGITIAYTP